jgi:predicted dehydrogenase
MSEVVRIAQVGIGYWGRNLLRNFSALPGVELRWACDQNEQVLRGLGERTGARTTTRFEDVLADPDVDGVVIATETPGHFAMASAALEAGKHIFVEKPMARTTGEARSLVERADARGLHVMVGHLLLYHPAFVYVRDLARKGDLGDIYYLYSTRVNLGIVRTEENAFESLAPHDLAVALSVIESPPRAISAQGSAYLQPGIEDVVFATVYFEDGAIAHLHTSWLDPHKTRKVTVVGSRMMAVVDDTEPTEKVRLFDKGVDGTSREGGYTDYANAMQVRSGDIRIPAIRMQEPLAIECRHFIDCIRTGSTPLSDARNGLAVVQLLDAGMRSLRSGGRIVDLTD